MNKKYFKSNFDLAHCHLGNIFLINHIHSIATFLRRKPHGCHPRMIEIILAYLVHNLSPKVISGILYLRLKLKISKKPEKKLDEYQCWFQQYYRIGSAEQRNIRKHIKKFSFTPKISVIMPTYNTSEKFLRAAIESVIQQLYQNWELCIADDASTHANIRDILTEYQKKDPRIKLVFRDTNGHISAASNSALSLVTGKFTALLDHDDELLPDSLYRVVEDLNHYPDSDIIYTDEDKIDEYGHQFAPHFKSDWNPELLYSVNYICHLVIYRTSLLRSVDGFRVGLEGSQDYDLILRCAKKTTKIRHLPYILYHWRAIQGSTALSLDEKQYATKAGIKALSDHFDTEFAVEMAHIPTTYRIHYPIPLPVPKVLLIIQSTTQDYVARIHKKTTYKNYEIILVNTLQERHHAIQATDALLVGFLHQDIEVISEDWLEEMVSYAIRTDIGAVGAKLLYPDNRIQHGGIILGLSEYSHHYCSIDNNGYFGRLSFPQTLSAVSSACLVVRRSVYEEVRWQDENDIDFCLRITQAGYRNVWTPYAMLYLSSEVTKHSDTLPLKPDPYYNPNLSLKTSDFSLAYPPRTQKPWHHH